MHALTKFETQQLALLHAHLVGGGALAPFAQEIFLVQTQVAGTSHVPVKEMEPSLHPGDTLILRREQDNAHDALAVLIVTAQGQKLGYLPREKNEIPARLMDAGKFLFAKLESKEWRGEWLRVTARVFLRDV